MSTKKSKLQISYESINNLQKNQSNAKIHTDQQIEQIIKSIKEFGFNDPIACDENYTIIEGHGRYLAALRMGLTTVPVIFLTGLNEEQKQAYMLIHNKLINSTGFDEDILSQELQNIYAINMEDFSFVLPETFFGDITKENHTAKGKSKIEVTCSEEKAKELRKWLDENKIEYKEK